MQEKWRPVVGYEGLYEVSNLGRIRRIRIVEPTRKKHGYMQISLARTRRGHGDYSGYTELLQRRLYPTQTGSHR